MRANDIKLNIRLKILSDIMRGVRAAGKSRSPAASVEIETEEGLPAHIETPTGRPSPVVCRLEDADYDGHFLSMLRRIADALDKRIEIRFVATRSGRCLGRIPKVMERMRRLRAGISKNDSAHRLKGEGVDVFIGKGTFTGPDTIAVDDKTLRFSKAVIATGARAAAPPIAGLKEVGYLTNETVFSLTELPSRLVVIGAGPIGCELSQAFARFGSEVHLLEAGDQILIREDSDAAERVAVALVRDGVKIVPGCKIRKVSKHGADKLVELECGGERRLIATDEILVGVGRAPNVEGLGLEAAGVKFDPRKGVVVDDRLRTSNPKVFAAGDCCFQYKFTHTADALARIVIQNALFGLPFMKKKASALTIPWCTYTDPEIAHVGYYEKDARDRGFDVETIKVELSDVDRAILDSQTAGFLKLHIDERTSRILGGTLVAEHAGEMIGELALAITTRLKIGAIAETIHPYPTQGEVFKRAADAWNRKRLTPGVKKLFTRFFKLFT